MGFINQVACYACEVLGVFSVGLRPSGDQEATFHLAGWESPDWLSGDQRFCNEINDDPSCRWSNWNAYVRGATGVQPGFAPLLGAIDALDMSGVSRDNTTYSFSGPRTLEFAKADDFVYWSWKILRTNDSEQFCWKPCGRPEPSPTPEPTPMPTPMPTPKAYTLSTRVLEHESTYYHAFRVDGDRLIMGGVIPSETRLASVEAVLTSSGAVSIDQEPANGFSTAAALRSSRLRTVKAASADIPLAASGVFPKGVKIEFANDGEVHTIPLSEASVSDGLFTYEPTATGDASIWWLHSDGSVVGLSDAIGFGGTSMTSASTVTRVSQNGQQVPCFSFEDNFFVYTPLEEDGLYTVGPASNVIMTSVSAGVIFFSGTWDASEHEDFDVNYSFISNQDGFIDYVSVRGFESRVVGSSPNAMSLFTYNDESKTIANKLLLDDLRTLLRNRQAMAVPSGFDPDKIIIDSGYMPLAFSDTMIYASAQTYWDEKKATAAGVSYSFRQSAASWSYAGYGLSQPVNGHQGYTPSGDGWYNVPPENLIMTKPYTWKTPNGQLCFCQPPEGVMPLAKGSIKCIECMSQASEPSSCTPDVRYGVMYVAFDPWAVSPEDITDGGSVILQAKSETTTSGRILLTSVSLGGIVFDTNTYLSDYNTITLQVCPLSSTYPCFSMNYLQAVISVYADGVYAGSTLALGNYNGANEIPVGVDIDIPTSGTLTPVRIPTTKIAISSSTQNSAAVSLYENKVVSGPSVKGLPFGCNADVRLDNVSQGIFPYNTKIGVSIIQPDDFVCSVEFANKTGLVFGSAYVLSESDWAGREGSIIGGAMVLNKAYYVPIDPAKQGNVFMALINTTAQPSKDSGYRHNTLIARRRRPLIRRR